MAIVFSLSKKGNHVKVEDVTVKFGLKVSKVGFIELEDAAAAAATLKELEAELAKNPTFIKLGQAFTTSKEIAGEDVATGKLYEVVLS